MFFLVLGATDSLSDDPQTLNSSHRILKTVKHHDMGMFLKLCSLAYSSQTRIMDQFEHIRIREEVMLSYPEEEILP